VLREKAEKEHGNLEESFEKDPRSFQLGDKRFTFKPTVYGADEVRDSLFAVQHNKCCYCESEFRHVYISGEVEHFRPKGFVQQTKGTKREYPG